MGLCWAFQACWAKKPSTPTPVPRTSLTYPTMMKLATATTFL